MNKKRMVNYIKWAVEEDTRVAHVNVTRKFRNAFFIITPHNVAEATIYWFCHGKRWSVFNGFNCRCQSTPVSKKFNPKSIGIIYQKK